MIKRLADNPRLVFLYDGLGALLSATLYGVVLVYFESYIVMSPILLYILAAIACIYACYSFACFFVNPENWRKAVKVIANANITHCLIVGGFVYDSFEDLTNLGLAYFIVDVLVIFCIAIIELKVANFENKV